MNRYYPVAFRDLILKPRESFAFKFTALRQMNLEAIHPMQGIGNAIVESVRIGKHDLAMYSRDEYGREYWRHPGLNDAIIQPAELFTLELFNRSKEETE